MQIWDTWQAMGLSYDLCVRDWKCHSVQFPVCRRKNSIRVYNRNNTRDNRIFAFSFGSYITYKSNAGVGDAKLAQWLGVSHRIGPKMAYWILPESCRSISCTIVQRLTNLEMKKDIWRGHINQFESKKKRILEAQSSCIQPDPQIIQS